MEEDRNNNLSSSTAPPEIRELSEIADFISGAGVSMKPCFRTRTYVHKDSWTGAVFRRMHGENGVLGAYEISRIADRIAHAISNYAKSKWHQSLCEKARHFITGVVTIAQTYQEYPNITPILNSSILVVEKSLSSN